MKNIEKATNNMKMVYSILCNLKTVSYTHLSPISFSSPVSTSWSL